MSVRTAEMAAGTHGGPEPLPPLDARGLPAGYDHRPDLEITPRQLRDACADPAHAPLLLDVRRPDEWDIARLEPAVFIPLGELERRADELDEHKHRPIAVMCHHGRRSMTATLYLRSKGFAQARSVAGGIDLWSVDIDPGVPRY